MVGELVRMVLRGFSSWWRSMSARVVVEFGGENLRGRERERVGVYSNGT